MDCVELLVDIGLSLIDELEEPVRVVVSPMPSALKQQQKHIKIIQSSQYTWVHD